MITGRHYDVANFLFLSVAQHGVELSVYVCIQPHVQSTATTTLEAQVACKSTLMYNLWPS